MPACCENVGVDEEHGRRSRHHHAEPADISTGFVWTSDFTWSTNKNQIVALSSGMTADVGNLRWVGQPINVYYDYKHTGLWQTADTALARTMCGCQSGQRSRCGLEQRRPVERRTIARSSTGTTTSREWQGSMNNRVTFRNFDVSVLTTARIGFTINDAFTAAYSNLAGRFNNISANYWTPENQSGTEPRPSVDGLGNFASARNYKDGSFVRIRDITLGYTLSRQSGEQVCVEGRAAVRPRAGPLHLHVLQGLGSGSGLQRRQREQRRVADRPGRSGFPLGALRRRRPVLIQPPLRIRHTTI